MCVCVCVYVHTYYYINYIIHISNIYLVIYAIANIHLAHVSLVNFIWESTRDSTNRHLPVLVQQFMLKTSSYLA